MSFSFCAIFIIFFTIKGWAVIGLTAETGIDTELLHGNLAQRREPFFELAIEIVAGITLPAHDGRLRAMSRKPLIDQARNGLIGREPVAIATAEHRIADAVESILRQIAAQPFDKLRRIVRRRAVIGRTEDHDTALILQVADIVIQRRELGGKAVDLGKVRHAIAAVAKRAPEMDRDAIILANLCGRGDKDIFTVADALGVAI